MYVNATEKEEDDCVANIAVAFATAKKLEWCGYSTVKKFDDTQPLR